MRQIPFEQGQYLPVRSCTPHVWDGQFFHKMSQISRYSFILVASWCLILLLTFLHIEIILDYRLPHPHYCLFQNLEVCLLSTSGFGFPCIATRSEKPVLDIPKMILICIFSWKFWVKRKYGLFENTFPGIFEILKKILVPKLWLAQNTKLINRMGNWKHGKLIQIWKSAYEIIVQK